MLKTRNEPNEWLSIHYQCTIHHRQNKSLLLRWIMKVKIRTILELLWKTWNDSLTDFQVGLIFDPAGVLLDEWGWNWNALKKVYGKDFIKRWNSLSKRMLEAKTWRCSYWIQCHEDAVITEEIEAHLFETSYTIYFHST